jgi:cell division septum initiation protein DivIVA
MELTPTAVSQATFRITRKGFEPDEVRRYLTEVSRALEAAQQQSSAMEARARAALAKLQEASQVPTGPSPDDAQAISRALLLAQRTADATVADADRRAGEILATATGQADEARSVARMEAAALVDAARTEARRARDEEYLRAENEVQALLARRDFLVADVEQLEQHLVTHRERLRVVAADLLAMAERGSVGLGDMRRPLLSAADDAGRDQTAALVVVAADGEFGEHHLNGERGTNGDTRNTAGVDEGDLTDPKAVRIEPGSVDPLLRLDDH